MTWTHGSTCAAVAWEKDRSDRAGFSTGGLLGQNRSRSLLHPRGPARLDFVSAGSRCRRGFALSNFLSIEVTNYPRHVGPGLIVRRHAAVLFHTTRAGIVGGQRLDHVKVIALQQLAQITRASLDIGAGIEGVGDSQL